MLVPPPGAGHLVEIVDDPREHRLLAGPRPAHPQVIVVQLQPAVGAVMRHYQHGLGVGDRAETRAQEQAVGLARMLGQFVRDAPVGVMAEGRRQRHDLRQHGGDRAGNCAFFDHEAVVARGANPAIDHAGDGRPHRRPVGTARIVRRGVPAHADAVDGNIAIITEGEEVAVAGEAFAQAR